MKVQQLFENDSSLPKEVEDGIKQVLSIIKTLELKAARVRDADNLGVSFYCKPDGAKFPDDWKKMTFTARISAFSKIFRGKLKHVVGDGKIMLKSGPYISSPENGDIVVGSEWKMKLDKSQSKAIKALAKQLLK